MFSIAEIEQAIESQEPALPYDYALWCGDVSRKLKEMADIYEKKALREIDRIVRDKIESQHYEIVFPVEQKQTVNLEKLKEEQPEIYGKIVHLKATDAVKLIGESKVYKMAAKSKNYNPEMDVITLADLKKALGKQAAEFIKIVYNPKGRRIVPIGTYHDPRELPEGCSLD